MLEMLALKLLEALKAAENGDFAKADSLVVEAGSCIAEAHNSQTAMFGSRSFWGGTSIQRYHDAWSGTPLNGGLLSY